MDILWSNTHTGTDIFFFRFLYTLFVAIDANFKLKGKERKIRDIELMSGLGAFVEEGPFKAHIANHVEEEEVCQDVTFTNRIVNGNVQVITCESQHDAIVRAATRASGGYSVTGVVAVICSRHCLIRKNGAGDLQKGEKSVAPSSLEIYLNVFKDIVMLILWFSRALSA